MRSYINYWLPFSIFNTRSPAFDEESGRFVGISDRGCSIKVVDFCRPRNFQKQSAEGHSVPDNLQADVTSDSHE